MRLLTAYEAAREIGCSVSWLRSQIKRGVVHTLRIGTHILIDGDEAAQVYRAALEDDRVSTAQLSAMTGLSERWIREAVKAGKLPAETDGGRLRFDPARAEQAIKAEMGYAGDDLI